MATNRSNLPQDSADASDDITSDQVTAYAGGNALLDAQVELTEQPNDAVDDEAATNFSNNAATREPSDGEIIETTGAYPQDMSQLEKADYPNSNVGEPAEDALS